MAERASSVEDVPAAVEAPPSPALDRRNVTKSRAWIGFWAGLLDVAFWGFMAWGPANDGAHSIGDTGEMFMMVGGAVLGVSVLILLQEATGTGYE